MTCLGVDEQAMVELQRSEPFQHGFPTISMNFSKHRARLELDPSETDFAFCTNFVLKFQESDGMAVKRRKVGSGSVSSTSAASGSARGRGGAFGVSAVSFVSPAKAGAESPPVKSSASELAAPAGVKAEKEECVSDKTAAPTTPILTKSELDPQTTAPAGTAVTPVGKEERTSLSKGLAAAEAERAFAPPPPPSPSREAARAKEE